MCLFVNQFILYMHFHSYCGYDLLSERMLLEYNVYLFELLLVSEVAGSFLLNVN